ncbi:DUF2946 family protein [Neogemmobacter tilapiae]|uniref:DUF2946 domain-containing protein n=1 Tax=Neogemmobacter tilapiae TaxID=875041 RepID=A0A918TTX2_9RHOB|nr:DUF2946 family protein [Gemmobacter tilapiae]GHC56435.1 hypothetical protein GCM10007315_19720 [Gemmobacter tilapiae]
MITRPSISGIAPLRLVAQMLMLLPFVILSLFAPGVMPTRGADGTMQVVLCSPEGPVHVTIGPDGTPIPTQDQPRDDRCDWAVNHVDLALLTTPALPTPLEISLAMPQADLWADHRPAHDPRGLYARGPPAQL